MSLKKNNLPIKAVLLIDNAPSHPSETELKTEDGNIIVMFIPPNVPPLIQPMDQNAIKFTKLYKYTPLLRYLSLGIGSAMKLLFIVGQIFQI